MHLLGSEKRYMIYVPDQMFEIQQVCGQGKNTKSVLNDGIGVGHLFLL